MFMFGRRLREARVLAKLAAEALRWKTALDAANKGARRKSGQARALRARVVELKQVVDDQAHELSELKHIRESAPTR